MYPNLENVVHDRKDCEGGEKYHPEPEENVNLLIDDIDGQNTDCIVGLGSSRRTVLEKGAFRDSRKYSGHWIDTFFRVGLQETQHFNPISTAGEERSLEHTAAKYHSLFIKSRAPIQNFPPKVETKNT